MRKISVICACFLLWSMAPGRGQDAATEERLNKLSGQLEDMVTNYRSLQKQLSEVAREVDALREQMASRPKENYASNEDVKRLAEAVREIDRNRLSDYDKIRAEILRLRDVVTSAPPPERRKPAPVRESAPDKPTKPEAGFEYQVQKGDTLSVIVQACREKGVKVTMDQILKANPGLKPERMLVGQKIFIPAP